jgi:hypothetical protein
MKTHVRNYKKRGRVERAKQRLAEWNKLSAEEKEAQKAESKRLYDSQHKAA